MSCTYFPEKLYKHPASLLLPSWTQMLTYIKLLFHLWKQQVYILLKLWQYVNCWIISLKCINREKHSSNKSTALLRKKVLFLFQPHGTRMKNVYLCLSLCLLLPLCSLSPSPLWKCGGRLKTLMWLFFSSIATSGKDEQRTREWERVWGMMNRWEKKWVNENGELEKSLYQKDWKLSAPLSR